jgi:hypothetical protein
MWHGRFDPSTSSMCVNFTLLINILLEVQLHSMLLEKPYYTSFAPIWPIAFMLLTSINTILHIKFYLSCYLVFLGQTFTLEWRTILGKKKMLLVETWIFLLNLLKKNIELSKLKHWKRKWWLCNHISFIYVNYFFGSISSIILFYPFNIFRCQACLRLWLIHDVYFHLSKLGSCYFGLPMTIS